MLQKSGRLVLWEAMFILELHSAETQDLYVSVAPVPCATVTNREWGTIGTNYFKGLCALAFQGFFMMVCVAIYAVLVAGVAVADNLHTALWSVAAYTVILCFSLFKTGSLSKSIWNAH